MTEIEQKALALVNEVAAERGTEYPCVDRRNDARWEALCRAIEQHEAFRQEVSDAAERLLKIVALQRPWLESDADQFASFIIPQPDPLVALAREMTLLDGVVRTDNQKAAIRSGRAGCTASDDFYDRLRTALAARSLKIVEDK
jgi:hypothetical protein